PASSLRVFSSQAGGRKAGALTVTGNTLSFDPATDFKPGEVVSVTVTTAAQSAAGVPLDTAFVYQFIAVAAGGTGHFEKPDSVVVKGDPYELATGDVDGDGDLDLLVSRRGRQQVTVCLNAGGGAFSVADSVPVGLGPQGLAVGDIDGDGDLDFVTANEGDKTVSVRFNDGAAHFTSPATNPDLSIPKRPFDVVLADMDGDGDLDLLSANYSSGSGTPIPGGTSASSLSVCRNDGSGTFGTPADVLVAAQPSTMAVGDLDNDGDLDVITVGYRSERVSVRFNNGLGAFPFRRDIAVAGKPQGVAVGDVDNDGDVDIVTPLPDSRTLVVCYNDGTGRFPNSSSVPAGVGTSVALGDLNGDGYLDAVSCDYGGVTIPIYTNDQTGHFVADTLLWVGPSSFCVTMADVDGDGDLDVLTSSLAGGGGISTWFNQDAPVVDPLLTAPQYGLWPNPAAGTATLGYPPPATDEPVRLVDALGRTVGTAVLRAGEVAVELPLQGLAPGLYIVRLGLRAWPLVVQ
ncbi:MAG TPA: FG-GAP-like repeat-containing protein, partial [bacterium]|nr:FG-GAP-like repeat-containing protein [bacterium]